MRPRERGTAGRKISSGPLSPKFVNAGMGPLPGRSVGRKPPSPGSCSGTLSPRADIRRFTPPEPINCAGSVKRSSNERPLYACGGSARRRMDARTDLRLVEIRERTAAESHRLRDNLRLHLSERTEGRGLVALSDSGHSATTSPCRRCQIGERSVAEGPGHVEGLSQRGREWPQSQEKYLRLYVIGLPIRGCFDGEVSERPVQCGAG
jgi:hypothetical protein